MRISGVKETKEENVEEVVLALAKQLQMPLDKSELSACHRVGRIVSADQSQPHRTQPRQILVELTSKERKMYCCRQLEQS